jgi:hypothetical protein
MRKSHSLSFPLHLFRRCARWLCLRLGRARFIRLRHHRRLRPHQRLERMRLVSSVASLFSTVVRNPGRAALRLVLRADRAATKIRVRRGSLPARALIPVGRVPSILRGRGLQVRDPVVRVDLAHVPVLGHVLALELRGPVDLAQGRVVLRLQARHRVLRVLRDRRVAVAVSSIPRPKKAR